MTDVEILAHLQDLVDYPHEDLNIEIKSWLDLANEVDKSILAKALMAIANHCGGYVVVGFRRENGSYLPDSPRPTQMSSFNDDTVNGIVLNYAEPAFHCQVHHITRKADSLTYPVVIVPGGSKVPIRAKRSGPYGGHVTINAYYLRRPGPSSDTPRSGQEWDALLEKCLRARRDEQLDDFREIIYAALASGTRDDRLSNLIQRLVEDERALRGNQRTAGDTEGWERDCLDRWDHLVTQRIGAIVRSPYAHGTWTASYLIDWTDLPGSTLSGLRDALTSVRGYTGWPPWWVPTRSGIAPYVYDQGIECWLYEAEKDPGHSDFWRAALPPRLFLLRGYQEDSPPQTPPGPPGTSFDLTLPAWRVGEVLMHSSELSQRLTATEREVSLRFKWRSLTNRRLLSWANPRRVLSGTYISRQDEVLSELTVLAASIPDRLPELVQQVTRPLYEVFDLFAPPPEMFHEELSRMRSRTL